MRRPGGLSAPLVSFDNATVLRPGGEVIFRGLNWTVREGETWAVVGPVGCGKTSLAETLLGRHHVESGSLTWPLLERLRAAGRSVGWPSEVIRHVSFKEESFLFSYGRHYYQQRFNFVEPHEDLTLDAFLRAGGSTSDEAIGAAARQLGIESRLGLSLLKLSNGEVRRARIARALLVQPEWLILDEPFMGVDAVGRVELAALLGDLVRHGRRLLLLTRPETVPEWVTHVLPLERPAPVVAGLLTEPQEPTEGLRSARGDRREAIVEMRQVHVRYGERAVLQDVTWTVRSGERWAVLGPNGSGKSTLLSLICADHPQAYANDLRLFGVQRGSGESIWEIKQRIGLVSPEFHLYFTEPLTAVQTAATGFFDAVTLRRTTPEQDATVRDLFEQFGVAELLNRPFARLSTGEQRLVLLIRALVKRPPLLVLDEPFQGLDAAFIRRARNWLDRRLDPEQTLLFVSHYAGEIPQTVRGRLRLEAGRVVEMVNP
jgi:molybdate transport system ATP-binding protein